MPGTWTSLGSSSTARPGWVAADALNPVAAQEVWLSGRSIRSVASDVALPKWTGA